MLVFVINNKKKILKLTFGLISVFEKVQQLKVLYNTYFGTSKFLILQNL